MEQNQNERIIFRYQILGEAKISPFTDICDIELNTKKKKNIIRLDNERL